MARSASLRIAVDTGDSAQRMQALRTQLDTLSQAGTAAARDMSTLGTSAANSATHLDTIIDALDPAARKLKELTQWQRELTAAWNKGTITNSAYNDYIKILQQMRQEQERVQATAANADFTAFVHAIDPAAAAMDRLTAAEKQFRTFHEQGRLSPEQFTQYSAALDKMRADLDGTTAAQQRLAAAAKAEDAALQSVRDRLDPLGTHLQRVTTEVAAVNKAFSERKIGETEHRKLIAQLREEEAELERLRVAQANSRATGGSSSNLTDYQRQFADRYLPYQVHDAFRSLEAGMNPMTVLLQQGSQVKDMYGSLGEAIKGVGGYLASLLNPALLATAALAAVAYTGYKIASAFTETKKQIMLAGRSYQEFIDLQSNVIAVHQGAPGVSLSTSSKAVALAASSAGIAYANITEAATVAAKADHILGKSVESTIKEYASLRTGGVDALVSLNDQYGYLTVEQYKQIRALEEQGKTVEAGKMAQELYLDKMREVAEEAERTLPAMERMWNAVGGAISKATDDLAIMMGFGSERQALQLQLETAQGALKNAQSSNGSFWGVLDGTNDETVRRRQAAVDAVQAQIDALDKKAAERGKKDNDSKIAVNSAKKVDDLMYANLGSDEKRSADRKKLETTLRESGASDAQVAKALAGFDENHKKTAAKVSQVGENLLKTAQQRNSELAANLENAKKGLDDLTDTEKALIDFNARVASASSKAPGKRTDEDKQLLAKQDAIRAQLEDNTLLTEAIRLEKERTEAVKEQTKNHKEAEKAIRDMNAATALQHATRGMGSQDATRYAARQAISDDPKLSAGDRTDKLAALEASYREADEAQNDWSSAAKSAWSDYLTQAKSTASEVKSAMSSAFDGATDALTTFVTTGKLSFSDLASSIISSMVKIAAQQAVLGLTGLFGGFGGGGATTISSGGFAGASMVTGNTGILSYAGAHADGGLLRGPGTGTSDSMLARVSTGEFIVREKSVTPETLPTLHAINEGRKFASGGYVSGTASRTYGRSSAGSTDTSAPVINMGGVTIQANSKEEGQDAAAGLMEGLRAQLKADMVQVVSDQTLRPGGVINRAIAGR